MPATATTMRVPVPTWREKAVLVECFAKAASREAEGLLTVLTELSIRDEIHAEDCADQRIDDYTEAAEHFHQADRLLRAIRALEPGPDAALEVGANFGLLERLDDAIQGYGETDVTRLVNPIATQRDIALATVAAYDLRERLGGGDA